MNLRRDPAKKEVSVYVEGIGTVDFHITPEQEAAHTPLAEISNDDQRSFAFGTGDTGIKVRVGEGINQVKRDIKKKPNLYIPKDEYIEKIVVDVIGFSRGAAAARHFVSRRAELQGPWLNGERPQIVLNFVGLYDTVSSFEETGTTAGNTFDKLTEGSFDRGIFEDDVKELDLAMHGVPKRVVHLTAADEYRSNFSLTTIDTSLAAGVGFELQLPGARSDVGGGYTEPDPHKDPSKPIRKLNKEVRVVLTDSGMQELIAQGWYRPSQFALRYQPEPLLNSHHIPGLGTTPQVRQRMAGYEAVRYLTNQYQYVALSIMLDFAQNGSCRPGGKAHTEMRFESFDLAKNARYRLLADLVKLRDEFLREAIARTGSRKHEQVKLLYQQVLPPTFLPKVKPDAPLVLAPAPPVMRWLRNKYLHISAHSLAEGIEPYKGMDGDYNWRRVVILDTVRLINKAKPLINKVSHVVEKAEQYKEHPLDLPKDVGRKIIDWWDHR